MEEIELNKLAPEAACKGNPKWEQMISRKAWQAGADTGGLF